MPDLLRQVLSLLPVVAVLTQLRVRMDQHCE